MDRFAQALIGRKTLDFQARFFDERILEQFKKKLMEINEISTLPQVMSRVMEIITDEKSCAADLANEIAKDKSVTAKMLKMVNSAYYGFYREIVKVSDAVVVLGFNEIKRLSLAMSVLDMFGKNKRTQHRPELAEQESELTRIVYVANRLANEFLRVKTSGMLILNVALEGDPEFPPEKKTKLLLELDRRIDGSTASDLITH